LLERGSRQTISRLLPVCERQVKQHGRGRSHRPFEEMRALISDTRDQAGKA
jgi:hypothetical protein